MCHGQTDRQEDKAIRTELSYSWNSSIAFHFLCSSAGSPQVYNFLLQAQPSVCQIYVCVVRVWWHTRSYTQENVFTYVPIFFAAAY